MSSEKRDIYILKKIFKYCAQAQETVQRFGDSVETMKSDNIYKNAAAMCVLQIGELVGQLSAEFTGIYTEMPWK